MNQPSIYPERLQVTHQVGLPGHEVLIVLLGLRGSPGTVEQEFRVLNAVIKRCYEDSISTVEHAACAATIPRQAAGLRLVPIWFHSSHLPHLSLRSASGEVRGRRFRVRMCL